MKKLLLEIKRKIANSLEIATMITEVERLRENAIDQLGPLLGKFAESYDKHYVSSEVKFIGERLNRYERSISKDAFLTDITIALEVIGKEAEVLLMKLRDENINAVMSESLDTKHALAIQFITLSEFVCEFTRATLIVVAEYENTKRKPEGKVDSGMEKYFRKNFTEQHLNAFAQVVGFFKAKRKEDTVEAIYKLPDIKVDETVINTVISTEGRDAVDPSGISVLSIFHVINPIAWVYAGRKIWSELKLKWLALVQDELDYLETRHQELLEIQQRGDTTIGTQRRIENYRDAIDVKRSQVKRIKEKLGDGNA